MSKQQIQPDVFVSYRRLNVEFVKAFVEELRKHGKDVWVDWEDIPPGSESFSDDIQRGIEGTDAFIAILSPDYLQSTYCVDMELGYALKLRKKIIPVVFEKFENYPIPDSISHINWIYFTPHAGQENTLTDSMPRVIEALDVDFEYVRDHTRLLQRAREWEENQRQTSYLLTGTELLQAEAWVAESATKQPSASVLHHNFIQSSRLQATQNTRRNLSIAILVTFLSIVLAAFALVQRQSAIEQRAIAEEQRAIAIVERDRAEEQQRLSDSRRLSVQSLVALDNGSVDESLLLGLEAIRSANTIEAVGSLVIAFEETPYIDTYLYNDDDDVSLIAIATHPSLPLVLVGGEDGSLAIWDIETHQLVHQVEATDDEIWDIAFSPDGDQFAVGTVDGTLLIYETESTELIALIDDVHQGTITSVNYQPDGDRLLTTSYDMDAILWDTATFTDDEPAYTILLADDNETTHTEWLIDASWSPDGSQVAILSWDNVLQIWNTDDGTLAVEPNQLRIGSNVFSISVTWSLDGRFILMGDVLGIIRFADATTGQLVDFQLSRHTDHVREIVYHPDGEFFVSVSHDGTIILWNASNGQIMTEYPIYAHKNLVEGVAFSSDGDYMFTIGDDGRVAVFDMTRPDLLGQHILTHEDEIYQVMATDDRVLSVGLDGKVYSTDTTTYESTVLLSPQLGRFTSADLSHDEMLLALATDTGIVQVWNLDTLEPLGEAFTAHTASIFGVAFNADDTQLATAGDDSIVRVWDVASLSTDTPEGIELIGHEDGVFDVAWHPTEPILASASRDTTVRLWDVATQTEINELVAHEDDVETLVFSPDGMILVSAGRDTNIYLWYLGTTLDEAIEPELLGWHDDWVLSLAFSPDGQTLISGGRDRAVILWDMESLQIIGTPLVFHRSWVWSVAVHPDGTRVFSGGRGNQLIVWDIDPNHWQELACHIANRSLTPYEWSLYRPSVPYQETCTTQFGN